MATHELKCWPRYLQAVVDGGKTVELRRDDRAYAVGDRLALCEWDPAMQCYTGTRVLTRVTHVLRDPEGRWLQPGVVALSIVALSIVRGEADGDD